MGAKGNSLLQLPQADAIEFFIQFGLSDKQDLQQLLLRSFQIAQKWDFLENFRRKVMRFVDHQGCRQIPLAASDDVMRDLKQQFTFVLAGGRKSQIAGKVLQKLYRGETAVKYIRVRDVLTLLE